MRTTSNPIIQLDNVTKRFRRREGKTLVELLSSLVRGHSVTNWVHALQDVSLYVEKGETLGIIGRNGSGKSTLLKLVAGVTVPTEGNVRVRGRVSPLIELGAGFHPDLTGRENIFLNGTVLGMTRGEILERWDDIVSFADFAEFMDTPLKHYSSGMFMRLGFAVAVHSEPDILIIDESLAVGDQEFQEKCFQKIRRFQECGVSIMLVSHSLSLIRDFCDRVVLLDNGRVLVDSDPAAAIQRYEDMTQIRGTSHL